MDITKFVINAKNKIKSKDYKGALSDLESILMFAGLKIQKITIFLIFFYSRKKHRTLSFGWILS